MNDTIPRHPSENPSLLPGIYDAAIIGVQHCEYAGEAHYIRIMLRLPEQMMILVTNIYLPHGSYSRKAAQRLSIFCACVGLTTYEIIEEPDLFKDRQLRIKLRQFRYSNGLTEKSYSDVELFAPFPDDETRNTELGMPMVPS